MTTPLDIRLDMDRRPWTDAATAKPAELMRIGILGGATHHGHPAVAMLLTDTEGKTIIAWTTYRLFRAAAKAFAASPLGLIEEEML